MNHDEYKKLEKKINNENFHESYKIVNNVLTFFSYFGHIASIFLAYFMLSKILLNTTTDNIVIVSGTSIIILATLELIKRSIFDKFSISFLKLKGLKKEVLPLFIISSIIIIISFCASIKGASDFSLKNDKIEIESGKEIKNYNDSLTNIYNFEIKELEKSFKSKDEMLTSLQNLALTQRLSKDQRNTITDLSLQKKEIQTQVKVKKIELKSNIDKHLIDINSNSKNKKKDNSKNSFLFVIISSVIELAILIGVYFNQYYKFRSYREFKSKLEKDTNYQKWLIYDQVMSIIITDETKVNQKLPSNKTIIEMCKINNIIVLPHDIMNFIKLLNGLNILKSSGSYRYICKQKDIASELLRNHFNIV